MRYPILGLFAFFGLLFTWMPAVAQCPNGTCGIPAVSSGGGILSADGQTLTLGGKLYTLRADGVYREATAPCSYCPCYLCPCETGGACKCGPLCECADCPGKPKPLMIGGITYYRGADGVYRQK